MSVVLEVENSTVKAHALEDLEVLRVHNESASTLISKCEEVSPEEIELVAQQHAEAERAFIRLKDLISSL